MKKSNHHLLNAILVLLTFTLTATAAESLSVLLQKGIFAEETEGNLDAAIQIYQKIADDAEANRSVVAQAQYRLGVCQLKKGKKEEAAAAFRKLIEQFPGERELLARTRERLSALGQTAASVLVRQLWAKAGDVSPGTVSDDGRFLSFVDWQTGDVAVRDFKTGQNRRLTNKGTWSESSEYAESSVVSRDGKQIAYSWRNRHGFLDLRVVSLENPQPRVIFNERSEWCNPEDWSPDGKRFTAIIQDKQVLVLCSH